MHVMKACHRQLLVLAVSLAASLHLARGQASGQEYPSKPIKILVPQGPGAPVDTLPRVLGQKIFEATKMPVVVENLLGWNGAIAGLEASKSPPDGYTLLSSFHALHAMLPHMTSRLRFDPNKDLTPIVLTLTVPNVLVVHPLFPSNR